MIKDGVVSTPRSGVLEGITRKIAMEICSEHNLTVSETELGLDVLLGADEVFVTTTGGGIIPVARVNDHIFSNNAPGELTQSLSDTYWQWHSDSKMSESITYD